MTFIIGLDFDGTLVAHPDRPGDQGIGSDIGAFEWLNQLEPMGAQLILSTIRTGLRLDEAIAHCEKRGVKFWGVNVNPDQGEWTSSPKPYCHVYVDDLNLGAPLMHSTDKRPFIDWNVAGPWLVNVAKRRLKK